MSGGPRKILVKRKRDDELDLPQALMRKDDLEAFRDGTYKKTHIAIWRRAKRQKSADPLAPRSFVPPTTYGAAAVSTSKPGDEIRNPYALPSLQASVDPGGSQPYNDSASPPQPSTETSISDRNFILSGTNVPLPAGGMNGRSRGDFLIFERRGQAPASIEDPSPPTAHKARHRLSTVLEHADTRKLKRPTTRKAYTQPAPLVIVQPDSSQPGPGPSLLSPGASTEQMSMFQDLARQLDAEKEARGTTQMQLDDIDIDDGDAMDIDPYTMDAYQLEHIAITDAAMKLLRIEPLFISEGEEAVWAEYAQSDDDDKEFETDDDDSNAEDYYGADYPEDELSDGDEFNEASAAYRNRRYGSGDEEYDLDAAVHSGDDEEDDTGNKRSPW